MMKVLAIALLIQSLLCCALINAQEADSTTAPPTTTASSSTEASSTSGNSTTSAPTTADANNTTTANPNCTTTEQTCGKKGDYCLENDQCCDSLVCNFLTCAKCVTARHGCEEDADCCTGLKCVQVAPVNNNNFFGQFFPIANKFNPTKQCTKVAKKKKHAAADPGAGGFGAGGFDWSHFVPFKAGKSDAQASKSD